MSNDGIKRRQGAAQRWWEAECSSTSTPGEQDGKKENRDHESVTARVREAVAFLLGRSPSERSELRAQTNDLYKARSSFAHDGYFDGPRERVFDGLELTRRVVAREMEVLAGQNLDWRRFGEAEPGTTARAIELYNGG